MGDRSSIHVPTRVSHTLARSVVSHAAAPPLHLTGAIHTLAPPHRTILAVVWSHNAWSRCWRSERFPVHSTLRCIVRFPGRALEPSSRASSPDTPSRHPATGLLSGAQSLVEFSLASSPARGPRAAPTHAARTLLTPLSSSIAQGLSAAAVRTPVASCDYFDYSQ